MKYRIPLVTLLLLFALPVIAIARPVSPHRARQAIQSDRSDWPTAPTVAWCKRQHYGTLCGVYTALCYEDQTFGASTSAGWNLVWVSRSRHDRIAVAIVGQEWFTIDAGTGCVVQDPSP